MRAVLLLLAVALVATGVYLAGAVLGWYGVLHGPGQITKQTIPAEVVAHRTAAESSAAAAIGGGDKQILFGDLHVHTTYSTDAFLWTLPIMGGKGAHPLADACDFARFCSSLDFWSINDHAEALTPRKWRETKQTIRECNSVSGAQDSDVIAFLGWEWTQVGQTAPQHYGHKNVVLRDLADDAVPARPIDSGGFAKATLGSIPLGMRVGPAIYDPAERQRYYDFDAFAREIAETPPCPKGVDTKQLPSDCSESAETPGELFEKLTQWGLASIVIPHGTTWGFYTPPDSSWDKQLNAAQHDPKRQTLIEIFSGHGNSEEFRDWTPLETAADGSLHCPPPRRDYLPSCWRAGEIMRQRCEHAGRPAAECEDVAARTRELYTQSGLAGKMVVPGETAADWLDSGQCRDCFQPSFNYRPKNSVQYIEALTNFDEPDGPKRFRFGFIASSDNHSARPGTGYKEFERTEMTEQRGASSPEQARILAAEPEAPALEPRPFDPSTVKGMGAFRIAETERQNSFWLTGGLVAVHATSRSRDGIWDALQRKETYGTSGPRILLWFDLMNPPGAGRLPMGSEVAMGESPRFEVRAVGSLEQKPGCPEFSTNALTPERLEYICKGECYNPSDQRRLITRIEVVRIRPQIQKGEPVGPLVEDPWQTFACAPDANGCQVSFEDPDFSTLGRDTLYYARAIEQPSEAVNAANLRCTYDDDGNCVAMNPCWGDWRTPKSDTCLSETEERAWSSPIYVDWQAPAPAEAPEDPSEAVSG
jgi:Protein of unknown function (DUF3604)